MVGKKETILAKSHKNSVRAGRVEDDLGRVATNAAKLEKKEIEERTGEKLTPTEERQLANKRYQDMIYGVRGD